MTISRPLTFSFYFLAIFLQSGAYGLTFLLPRLFDAFGANEKVVGTMLFVTTIATLLTVYFAGHLSDYLGRVRTLGWACIAIAASLGLFGWVDGVGIGLVLATILLGFGWGLTYSLAPVVLTRLVGAHERVRYFALQSVFVMAGFGLSPVFASLLEAYGFRVNDAFYATAFLCLISAALFFALVGPIREKAVNKAVEAASRLTLSNVAIVLRSTAWLPVTMVCIGASVFAGLNNFQTVFADQRGLDYATFFFVYTLTVVIFRLVLVRFTGGTSPYRTIAILQYIMCASVLLFMVMGSNYLLYILVAFLFGLGYGVSYPILVAMAANDAPSELVPQTLQLFALTYFIGIFGFPLIAGWIIVELGAMPLLFLVMALAAIEASMALVRSNRLKRSSAPNPAKL